MIKAGLLLSSRERSLLLTLELAWLINLSFPSGEKRTSPLYSTIDARYRSRDHFSREKVCNSGDKKKDAPHSILDPVFIDREPDMLRRMHCHTITDSKYTVIIFH